MVGGKPDSYIKLKEVEQSPSGNFYAFVYLDDGKFRLRTFGDKTRTQEEIEEGELDINEQLDLDNYTMPIDNFPDPFITCAFINHNLIFVNLYHTASTTHHSFIYNHATKKVSSKLAIKMDSNK